VEDAEHIVNEWSTFLATGEHSASNKRISGSFWASRPGKPVYLGLKEAR
jgi:hypothetical protein